MHLLHSTFIPVSAGKYRPTEAVTFHAYGSPLTIPGSYLGGPTVPRGLRWIVPPERIVRAGYLHDALGHFYRDQHPKVVHDAIFYQVAKDELNWHSQDLPAWRRRQIAVCAYLGVRIADLLRIKQSRFEPES